MNKIILMTLAALLVSSVLITACLPSNQNRQDASIPNDYELMIDDNEAQLSAEEIETQAIEPDDSLEQIELELENTVIFEEDLSDIDI